MDKEKLIERKISETVQQVLKEEQDKFSKSIETLDKARQGFEQVRSEIIMYMPHDYQTLFKDDLNTVLLHMNEGIIAIEKLAQKMHVDLNR